jgi:glycine/D-amino acid oxidase-like deaminating enzyme
MVWGSPPTTTLDHVSDYADLSLWHDTMPAGEFAPRPRAEGAIEADVAIVGGGLTGLWTAYYLRSRDPSLRIVVLESEVAGFGASGRNGGWCSALLPMSIESMAASHSLEAALRLQREMFATVDEVGRVADQEGIDCHFAKGGTINLARSEVQELRLRRHRDDLHRLGFTDADYRWLDADETRQRVGATNVRGAVYTPHCAAIHPSRLVRGVARAVESQGTIIHEHSRVTEIGPHLVRTADATVRAGVVVRATEAFTSQLPGHRRAVAPVYSLMIATEPLADDVVAGVGLRQRETFNDARRMVIYGQRTADNRLAFGGRGAPYHFASAMRPEFDRHAAVHSGLADALRDLFPELAHVRITHRWGGAVGVPRDWWCSVGFDRTTGMAAAGGYVGDGVGTTNLAGRTLADLITGTDSPLVDLPWVGHRSRRWEPEPLRWLGINTMVRLPSGADRFENRTGRTARVRDAVLRRVIGH